MGISPLARPSPYLVCQQNNRHGLAVAQKHLVVAGERTGGVNRRPAADEAGGRCASEPTFWSMSFFHFCTASNVDVRVTSNTIKAPTASL